MNANEKDYQPNSRPDTQRTNAARSHSGIDPISQLSSTNDRSFQEEQDRDKEHTFMGKPNSDKPESRSSEADDATNQSVNTDRDKDHAMYFRGETAYRRSHSKHTGKSHHAGGDTDPGFGATDRG